MKNKSTPESGDVRSFRHLEHPRIRRQVAAEHGVVMDQKNQQHRETAEPFHGHDPPRAIRHFEDPGQLFGAGSHWSSISRHQIPTV
jgi:hypothetical protein